MQAKPPIYFKTARTWAARLLLGALAGSVGAQAADPVPPAADHGKVGGPQQQRRAALRAALLAQREAEAPKPERTARQLTPTERAKLREQLRQQRRAEPQDRNRQSQ